MLRAVAPVWASPDDDELRRVVADALLEQEAPWGELIALQLRIADRKATPADRKRAAALERKQAATLGGPILGVCRRSPWKVEKGFLVECAPQKTRVPRPLWEAAARAPHWATVRRILVAATDTPQWWITELMRNPAIDRSLRIFDVGSGATPSKYSLRVERTAPGEPWRVVAAAKHAFYGAILAAFAKGLAAGEQARLVIAPGVPAASREMLQTQLARVGLAAR